MRLPTSTTVASAAAAAVVFTAASTQTLNPIFGIYDQTADELADLFNVDDVPPPVVAAVRALRPVYNPLKALTPSCTDGLFPEFNDDLDMNDCLLLPRRVLWRGGTQPPLVIRQTMGIGSMWEQSTGSTVWGGGLALARYMEAELGPSYFEGKRTIELGAGTGLASITAAKLGAATVLATDRDAAVLELTAENARGNGAPAGVVQTAELNWSGDAPTGAVAPPWDLVLGADLTYNREAWPALVAQLKALRAPALLSASERRPNELDNLRKYLTDNGLRYDERGSGMARGYAKEKVRLFWIDRYEGAAEPAKSKG